VQVEDGEDDVGHLDQGPADQRRLAEDQVGPGTDVMILKMFSPKNSAKKLALLTRNNAKF
jgi:hypothetical protein